PEVRTQRPDLRGRWPDRAVPQVLRAVLRQVSGTTRRQALAGGIALAATAGLTRESSAKAGSMDEVLDTHDSLGLAALVKARKVSANELLEAAIARAEAANPRFNFM